MIVAKNLSLGTKKGKPKNAKIAMMLRVFAGNAAAVSTKQQYRLPRIRFECLLRINFPSLILDQIFLQSFGGVDSVNLLWNYFSFPFNLNLLD